MQFAFYLATLALVAGISVAKADVYSVSTPLQGEADSTIFLRFTAPHFARGRGNLMGVSLFLYGSTDVTATGSFGQPYANDPVTVGLVNHLQFIGDGVNANVITPNLPETATGTFSDLHATNVPVSATFNIPEAQLVDYANPAISLSGDFGINSIFFNLGTSDLFAFHPGGSIVDLFTGTLTTTFIYKPVHVPEPGSLALLGTGAFILAGATSLKKRRPRS